MRKLYLLMLIFITIKSSGQTESIIDFSIGNGYDKTIYSINSLPDGYIISGNSEYDGDPTDNFNFLAKFDSLGNPVWCKNGEDAWVSYGEAMFNKIIGDSVVCTLHGVYLPDVACWNLSGQIIWSKDYYSPSYLSISDITKTRDNGFILGSSSNPYPSKSVIIKVDSAGGVLWSKDYNFSYYSYATKIFEMPNGGFLITGNYKDSTAGRTKEYFMQSDALGNSSSAFGFYDSDSAFFDDAVFDNDSSLYILGNIYDQTHTYNPAIYKMNIYTGLPVWCKEYMVHYSSGHCSMSLENNSLYVSFDSLGVGFLIHMDTSGNPSSLCSWPYYSGTIAMNVRNNIIRIVGSKIISLTTNTTGTCVSQVNIPAVNLRNVTNYNLTVSDSIIQVTDSSGIPNILNGNITRNVICSSTIGIDPPPATKLFIISPVPVINNLNIKSVINIPDQSVLITDMTGRIILNEKITSSDFNLPMKDISSGFYIVSIITDGEIVERRLIEKI